MDFRILRRIFINFFKVDRFNYPRCDVLTFASDPDRYLDVDGVMYSPLINSVEDSLSEKGVTSVSITRIASKYKGKLAYGRVYGPDGAFTRAMIFKRIKGFFVKKGKYPFSNMEVKVWSKIFDVIQPKVVIAILPSRELCKVCRDRGIWVADLQHGVISDEHYWYGESFRKNDPIEWLPNAFLVWDKGSANVLERWTEPRKTSVKVLGNPWIHRFKCIDPNDKIVAYLNNKYAVSQYSKPSVLVSLSWGCTDLDNGFMHPELEKLIKETAKVYSWYIRLHNTQVHGFASHEGRKFSAYFKSIFGDLPIDWQNCSKMPLPLLLSHIDMHVTWISSVCMEASYFGIPSLVLSPQMQKGGDLETYFDYLVDLGYVTKKSPTQENIRRWFDEQVKMKRLEFYSDLSSEYSNFIDGVKLLVDGDIVINNK